MIRARHYSPRTEEAYVLWIRRLNDLVRAQRPQRLPVVRTVDEVRGVIDAVEEPSRLIVKLLYGSGLPDCACWRP